MPTFSLLVDLRKGKAYDKDYLFEVYSKKTSDLFKAACVSSAIVSGRNQEDILKIENFADNLGLAFQIQDDLLEDTYKDELNILNLMDRNKAEEVLETVNINAKEALKSFENNEVLLYLIDYLTNRSY